MSCHKREEHRFSSIDEEELGSTLQPLSMSQCLLVGSNGLMSLQIPEPVPRISYEPADFEWTKTDLDEIRVEDLVEEAARLHNELVALMPRVCRRWWRATYPSMMQTRLSNQNGDMVLRRPQPLRPRALGPAPTDCDFKSWPSIFTLPAELRLFIYRDLLKSDTQIRYPICPNVDGLRIVTSQSCYAPNGLWPEILSTCRLINREATPILYEENMFHREFYWPLKWTTSKGRRPRSLAGTYRLSTRNIQFITRIHLFRQYSQWLSDDGSLKIFKDFPSLKELDIYIDLNDLSPDTELEVLWQNAMRSASRRRPLLMRVRCKLRLSFGRHSYQAWLDRCRNGRLDFSIHRLEKSHFENWMRSENLFPGRVLTWSFDISTSHYCGPDGCIEYVIDDRSDAGREAGIPCRTRGDYDESVSIEPY